MRTPAPLSKVFSGLAREGAYQTQASKDVTTLHSISCKRRWGAPWEASWGGVRARRGLPMVLRQLQVLPLTCQATGNQYPSHVEPRRPLLDDGDPGVRKRVDGRGLASSAHSGHRGLVFPLRTASWVWAQRAGASGGHHSREPHGRTRRTKSVIDAEGRGWRRNPRRPRSSSLPPSLHAA